MEYKDANMEMRFSAVKEQNVKMHFSSKVQFIVHKKITFGFRHI